MKNSEITGLSKEELIARIAEESENLTKLKFAHSISAIENPSRISKLRRDVARLNTVLTQVKNAASTETKNLD